MHYLELKKHVLNENGKMLISVNVPFQVNTKQEFLAFADKMWDKWLVELVGSKEPTSWSDIIGAENDLVMKMLKGRKG